MPAQTTLSAAISTTNATSCTVRDVLGFASSSETDDLVLIDSEYVLVTSGLGTTSWTITRGVEGSTAATHLNGATVTRIERGWTDLVRVKRALDIPVTDTDDDAYLLDLIDETNSELSMIVGLFIGPSTDTVRYYSGDGTSRLYIPAGIRTCTRIDFADTGYGDSGVTWTQTTGDLVLGPLYPRSDDAYRYIDLRTPVVFPAGFLNIKVTGTFGRSAVPANGSAIATMIVARMMADRRAGSLAAPTPSKFIYPDDRRTLERLASVVEVRLR